MPIRLTYIPPGGGVFTVELPVFAEHPDPTEREKYLRAVTRDIVEDLIWRVAHDETDDKR